MLIIGIDYHPSFQQIAFVDTETGDCGQRRLTHRVEAENFYRNLIGRRVLVGMEATGHARWLERLLAVGGRLAPQLAELKNPAAVHLPGVKELPVDRPSANYLPRQSSPVPSPRSERTRVR